MTGSTDHLPRVARLADELARALDGRPLLAADAALDNARRLVWFHILSGVPIGTARQIMETPDEAAAVAARLQGLSFREADAVLSECRSMLWTAEFSQLPGSAFGATFQAFAERRTDPKPPGKLN